jgi:hypothetical protein
MIIRSDGTCRADERRPQRRADAQAQNQQENRDTESQEDARASLLWATHGVRSLLPVVADNGVMQIQRAMPCAAAPGSRVPFPTCRCKTSG